jgi:hypothetical protein
MFCSLQFISEINILYEIREECVYLFTLNTKNSGPVQIKFKLMWQAPVYTSGTQVPVTTKFCAVAPNR